MKKLVTVVHDNKRNYFFKGHGWQIMTNWGLGRYIDKLTKKTSIETGVVVYMSREEFDEYEKRERGKEAEAEIKRSHR